MLTNFTMALVCQNVYILTNEPYCIINNTFSESLSLLWHHNSQTIFLLHGNHKLYLIKI